MQHLYRHFNIDGELLYIGISSNALRRLAEHRGRSAWFDTIHSVTIEHFETRYEVAIAEREAITKENPIHNIKRSKSLPVQKVNMPAPVVAETKPCEQEEFTHIRRKTCEHMAANFLRRKEYNHPMMCKLKETLELFSSGIHECHRNAVLHCGNFPPLYCYHKDKRQTITNTYCRRPEVFEFVVKIIGGIIKVPKAVEDHIINIATMGEWNHDPS